MPLDYAPQRGSASAPMTVSSIMFEVEHLASFTRCDGLSETYQAAASRNIAPNVKHF